MDTIKFICISREKQEKKKVSVWLLYTKRFAYTAVQLTMACIYTRAQDRSCTRECVTDRNGAVAAAVTSCFVPNQACSAAIDDFARNHATVVPRTETASLFIPPRFLSDPPPRGFAVVVVATSSFCSSPRS